MNDIPLKILCVDDNPSDVETLRRYFRKIDLDGNIDAVHTARQAHEQLDENDYTLLLLDYRLPDRDGLELLKSLRKRDKELGIIMLTGKGNEQIAAASMRRGADDYLSKSDLTPSTLKYSINFVLRQLKQETSKKQQIQELRKKAELDELTGLHNRRALEERLEEETTRARRYGTTLSLMMMDLDQFKPVNDRFGHVKGDELLEETGQIILQIIRESDYAARFGGDEFCIITTQTHVDDAEAMARRLCRQIKQQLTELVGQELELSCSIGIAEFQSNTPNSNTLIHQADKAMYMAKNLGGDCVFVMRGEEEGSRAS